MDKLIVFKNLDGSCGIIIPAIKAIQEDESYDDFIERVANKDVPQGLEWRIIDADKIPADRTFRNAWTDDLNTETVDIDLEKAKDIWKDKLRQERAPLLSALDVDFMKAIESGNATKQEEIAEKKQELRDITDLVNNAETLEDIVSITIET